jgi:hypothetical protein
VPSGASFRGGLPCDRRGVGGAKERSQASGRRSRLVLSTSYFAPSWTRRARWLERQATWPFRALRFSARGLEPGSQEVYGGHALGWAWACRLLIAAGRSESGRPGGHQLVVVLVEPEPCPRDKPGYSLRPKLIPLCTKAALTEKTTPGEVHQESTRLSPPVIVSHFLSRGSGARSDLR